MRRRFIVLAVFAACFGLAFGAQAQVKKAKGSIELSDASGDVEPINTSGGKYPGLDVVKLKIASNGKQLKFAVTLKDPPGNFASSVAEVYFDTDNDPKSGARLMFFRDRKGFDYRSEIDACIKYDNGMTACTGGSSKAKVLKRFGAMGLDRLKGKTEEQVVSVMGFSGSKAATRTPIEGKVVVGVLDYEDLKVKPGQTIRILVRESCGPLHESSLFPEVLLTLD